MTAAVRIDWRKWRVAELAILVIAFLIQAPLILNADLGWLLTVCEKMLAGQKLYVDVIELNPPLSVFLYLPAAFLASVLHIPAHLLVIAMILPLAWGSTLLTARILGPTMSEAAARRLRLILLIALAILPGATFGQREHFAVLGLVPFVALAAIVGDDRAGTPSTGLRIFAGLCAGFAMSIKPHFALVAGLPLLWNAARRRSLKPLFGVEFWCASLVVVAYAVVVFLAFPRFFGVYSRWAATVYVPIREPLTSLLDAPLSVIVWVAILLWIVRGTEREGWRGAAPWLLAALGGFLSYLLQGKGWAYTRLPAAEFALLSVLLAPSVLELRPLRRKMVAVQTALVGLGVLMVAAWLVPDNNSFAYLRAPIRAVAPPHPKIIAVTSNVGVGEPLTHKLGAEWGSGLGSQLLSGSAIEMLQDRRLDPKGEAMAKQIIASERARLRHDLIAGRPDVVLFGDRLRLTRFDWQAWAREDPAVAVELDKNYCFAGRVRAIRIWARRTEDCSITAARLERATGPKR